MKLLVKVSEEATFLHQDIQKIKRRPNNPCLHAGGACGGSVSGSGGCVGGGVWVREGRLSVGGGEHLVGVTTAATTI